MNTIRQMAADIVAREGGFVNDPDDPGGATNHGVTIGTMRALGIDVTGDGKTTVEDVRALTRDQAIDIFVDRYFHGPKIDQLPDIFWETVFDMQVNAGRNAIRILQRLLSDMGLSVTIDGAVGPQTIAAAGQAAQIAPDHLVDAYGIARRNYYFDLADRRPASRKYARSRKGGKGGWIRRAEAFIDPKFHLTEQEFRKRTAAWA